MKYVKEKVLDGLHREVELECFGRNRIKGELSKSLDAIQQKNNSRIKTFYM